MHKIAKAAATVTLFGLLSPLIGTTLIFLYARLAMPGNKHIPIPLTDFLQSIIEFGIPASIGGLVFFLSVRLLSRHSSSGLSTLSRGFAGAGSLAIIFMIPAVSRLMTHRHLHRVFLLIAVLAAIAGFVLGLACPKAWLHLDSRTQNRSSAG